ncbi:MAG: hypothetical protein FJ279_11375 [Planctomycetes bacterium]|nr:hypothetical protein [Planctomycetota bacterium]MBM4082880.1 hypothetical protein [Planctomycetota bacterium]
MEVTCPHCGAKPEYYYIPDDIDFAKEIKDGVCRCPHCHGGIDAQVDEALHVFVSGAAADSRKDTIESLKSIDDLLKRWKDSSGGPA